MRWFKRKSKRVEPVVNDGSTPGPYAAHWWVPGCTCHWSAGVDMDYCDFCKSGGRGRPSLPEESNADPNPDAALRAGLAGRGADQ